jgi:ribosomal protein L29
MGETARKGDQTALHARVAELEAELARLRQVAEADAITPTFLA